MRGPREGGREGRSEGERERRKGGRKGGWMDLTLTMPPPTPKMPAKRPCDQKEENVA
jgi:hypothetical protein